MRPVRRLLVLVATIVALTLFVPVAAASEGSRHSGDLHVTKECSQFTGLPGSFCTITSSNFAAIKVGSKVVYAKAPGATSIDSDIFLVVSPGNVAFGHIYLDFVTNLGVGTFSGGTGTLTNFHARFVITDHPLTTGLTNWDGTYSIGHHDGDRHYRIAENTFTKWITGPGPAPIYASMAGFVGGDVGNGTFTGEVLTLVDNPAPPTGDGTRVINAVYHFNGSRHSFTASVHVVATGHAFGDTAVLIGVVTDGWLKGGLVEAGYTQITCSHGGPPTTCFQGTLDILRGSKH